MTISLVICTFNPRKSYLQRVLEALRSQTLTPDRWELIVIDNNSNEPVEGYTDLSWHPSAKILVEGELGLTAARLRGIQSATGDVIIFVDDDNILNPDYLEICSRIEREFPFLGAWGGSTPAEYETPPSDWVKDYVYFIGVRTVESIAWSNFVEERRYFPIGAGLAVRKNVASAYSHLVQNDSRRKSLDRKGVNVSGCGDTDLALTACDLGLGTGVFPELSLIHLIPKERIEPSYLLKLMKGSLESEALLQYLRFGKVPKAPKVISKRKQLLRWWLNRKQPKHFNEIARARDEARQNAYRTIRDHIEHSSK